MYREQRKEKNKENLKSKAMPCLHHCMFVMMQEHWYILADSPKLSLGMC
jgi:hypothetical protein